MASSNRNATARDMVLTMLVFMVPILLITWFFQRVPDEPPIEEVAWTPVVEQAVAAKQFPVVTLAALPEGWRATKARWMTTGQQGPNGDPVAAPTLELGFLSTDGQHFALNQTIAPHAVYLDRVTRQGTEWGTVTVNGQTWQHWVSADERTHSLVFREGTLTRVLVSDAGKDRLVEIAGMLVSAG